MSDIRCRRAVRPSPANLLSLVELTVFFVRNGFEPLVGSVLAGNLECKMGEPAIGRRPVPVLDIGRDIHHVAGTERPGSFAPLLIPPPSSGNKQNLPAAAGGAVDVPVVAAARRERDAAYGYLLGGEHIQITGAVKVRGKGGVLRPCVEGAGAVELFQCHGAISSPARRIFHLRLFAPILSRAGLTGKRRFCTMVSTKSLNGREERPCSTPNWPPLSAWPTAAASARRRKSSTSRPRR